MTGARNDGEQHIVIQWDAGSETSATEPPDGPAVEPPSLFQRYRYWLYALVSFAALAAIVYGAGEATYHPQSRLPLLTFQTDEPLYGTNTALAAEIDLLHRAFASPSAVDLELQGRVFRIALPRTLGDRLFGERNEVARVFSATSSAGDFRFLLLTGDDARRIFAVEAPLSQSPADQPTGVFLALDPGDSAFQLLLGALEGLIPQLDGRDTVNLSPENVYVFGPYQRADARALQSRVDANVVMRHLAEAIAEAGGGVTLASPLFLVAGGPDRGTINAIYHPPRRAVMEPLWGTSSTASLGHEMAHAYFDTVVKDRDEVLSRAAAYLANAHPVLHGEVVSDLYHRLGPEGRAEESLAFIVGSLAAGQTKTVATQRLLDNPGNLAISEAILNSDVGFLVQLGLLPPCMLPNEGATGQITQAFYDMVERECE